MARTDHVRNVQARLQELFETMPPGEAEVLEAVVTGTPLEVRHEETRPSTTSEETSIIIVGGRDRRWLVFDLDRLTDRAADLNPQPLPPDPDPFR